MSVGSERRRKIFWRGIGSALPYAFGGILAGILNGLVGSGGGVVLVLLFSGGLAKDERKDAFANALAVMLPLSLLSLCRYAWAGYINAEAVSTLGIATLGGAAIGGVLSGLILPKLRSRVLSFVFCLLTALSGVLMLFRA